jgi:hypothetical protein
MAQKFAQSLKVNRGFVPSQPVAGEANDTVYAGENIVFKGSPQNVYAEVFPGGLEVTLKDIAGADTSIPGPSPYPIVCTYTNGSDEIRRIDPPAVGIFPYAGTPIIVDRKLYLITRILAANVAKIHPAFEGTDGDYSTLPVPTLCAMNNLIGVCYGGGSAISLPKGHIMTSGIMRKLVIVTNPAPTGMARLVYHNNTLAENPGLILLNDDDTYSDQKTLGFTAPPPPTLLAVAGGIKNMPAGRYSIRIARSSLETAGYGNSSEAVEITLTAGQRIEATFPVPTENQTAWRVFCSLYSVAEGITGPWYEMAEVKEGDLLGHVPTRTELFEWRDYEIAGSQLVTFDNEIPPRARFMAMYGGTPVLIGALGLQQGIVTAPGPSVQPGKPYNIEAFPPSASLAMGPVQDIVSFVEGEGRLYVATNNYIHILSLTGNADQPLTVRPFVQCAIIKHNALVYVEGVLYGFSAQGPVRVSGEGSGLEDRIFAAPVRAVTEQWEPGRVSVVYDPHNEAILWVHSNDSLHGGNVTFPEGFWRTMVLSYSLPLGVWSTPLWIERDDEDMNISGVTTLGSRAYLITDTGHLLMWDHVTGDQRWFMATPFIDQPGAPGSDRNIRHLTVTHRGGATKAGIFGMRAGGPEPDLKANVTASFSGEISVPPAGPQAVTATPVEKLNVRNMRLYSVKIMGVNDADNVRLDRVDEIIIDGNVHGPVT